jgi:hypothetical protein
MFIAWLLSCLLTVFCLCDFCWRHLRLGMLRGNYSSRGQSVVPHRVRRKVTIYFKFNVWYSGCSVGIVTDYGLDGPGIESRWGRDFMHLSRPALGPTQPPVKWVPVLSLGVKYGRGVLLTHSHPSSAEVLEE